MMKQRRLGTIDEKKNMTRRPREEEEEKEHEEEEYEEEHEEEHEDEEKQEELNDQVQDLIGDHESRHENENEHRNDADEDDYLLPPGWIKKESKSQPGKFYYVSPTGQTQWIKPLVKAVQPKPLNWVFSIYIEFGPGRLGIGLKEVERTSVESSSGAVLYTEYQAEVDDIPKLPNGKAGPAQIYNWSVKPEMRLQVGMRMIAIGDTILSGYTYKEILDLIKKAPRPVKIQFADVAQGTLEKPGKIAAVDPATQQMEQQQQTAFTRQKRLQLDFQSVQVLTEIKQEQLQLSNRGIVSHTHEVVAKMAFLYKYYQERREEYDRMKLEEKELLEKKNKCRELRAYLKMQSEGSKPSLDIEKMTVLMSKHSEMTDEIEKMVAENHKLRSQRSQLQESLDKLEQKIQKVNDDCSILEDMDGLDVTQPLSDQIHFVMTKTKMATEELKKEDRRIEALQSEIAQLSKQLDSDRRERGLNRVSLPPSSKGNRPYPVVAEEGKSKVGSDVDDVATINDKQDEDNENDKDDKNVIKQTEAKIEELRQKLHDTVKSISSAAKSGDKEVAKQFTLKRSQLKQELQREQDKLRFLLGPTSSSPPTTTTSTSTTTDRTMPRTPLAMNVPPLTPSSRPYPVSVLERTPPTLSGYLEKSPRVTPAAGVLARTFRGSGAKERWCVLDETGVLYYYKRKNDSSCRGSIQLADETLEIVLEEKDHQQHQHQRGGGGGLVGGKSHNNNNNSSSSSSCSSNSNSSSSGGGGREFQIVTSSYQIRFVARTSHELKEWVDALRTSHAIAVAKKQVAVMNQQPLTSGAKDSLPASGPGSRATLGF